MRQWLANKTKGLRQVWAFDNRLQLLVQRTFFARERLSVYRLGGMEILVDHFGGDANGAREILTTTMYTDHLARFEAQGPAKILDCGANNGGFILLLTRLGIPLERIVCVELNPRTCMRLRFNLDRNIEAPHDVVNAALCARSGPLTVALGEGSVGDNIYEVHDTAARPVNLEAMTFNELFTRSFGGDAVVDLCKIDIEHAEYEVFASPGHELIDRCRFLILELHRGPGEDPGQLVRHLNERGFEPLPRGSDPDVYSFRNRAIGR